MLCGKFCVSDKFASDEIVPRHRSRRYDTSVPYLFNGRAKTVVGNRQGQNRFPAERFSRDALEVMIILNGTNDPGLRLGRERLVVFSTTHLALNDLSCCYLRK